MSNIPEQQRYTVSHEWVRREEDGSLTIGITDHAQQLLGDVVFFEAPEVDASYDAEQECGVVESVKAASDIYMPIAGKVLAVNQELVDAPEIVNEDPYQQGWMFRIEADSSADYDALMDANAYSALVAEES